MRRYLALNFRASLFKMLRERVVTESFSQSLNVPQASRFESILCIVPFDGALSLHRVFGFAGVARTSSTKRDHGYAA